jgi:predicted DNA binding CopG/RHH family protein
VQTLTIEQIAWGKKLSVEERVKFVEDFMRLAHDSSDAKSKLISIKMPEDLLRLFKTKCAANGLTYQTHIKQLMKKWILED